MSQTNAEDRLLADQLVNIFFCVWHCIGISRTVGEKNSVGIPSQDFFRGSRSRNYSDATAGLGKIPENIVFDAKIVSHHEIQRSPKRAVLDASRFSAFSYRTALFIARAKLPHALIPIVTPGAGHIPNQVAAHEPRRRLCLRNELFGIGSSCRYNPFLGAIISQVAYQR